eukprot:jgi/Psemu1/66373/estExt_Genemark1.C_2010003
MGIATTSTQGSSFPESIFCSGSRSLVLDLVILYRRNSNNNNPTSVSTPITRRRTPLPLLLDLQLPPLARGRSAHVGPPLLLVAPPSIPVPPAASLAPGCFIHSIQTTSTALLRSRGLRRYKLLRYNKVLPLVPGPPNSLDIHHDLLSSKKECLPLGGSRLVLFINRLKTFTSQDPKQKHLHFSPIRSQFVGEEPSSQLSTTLTTKHFQKSIKQTTNQNNMNTIKQMPLATTKRKTRVPVAISDYRRIPCGLIVIDGPSANIASENQQENVLPLRTAAILPSKTATELSTLHARALKRYPQLQQLVQQSGDSDLGMIPAGAFHLRMGSLEGTIEKSPELRIVNNGDTDIDFVLGSIFWEDHSAEFGDDELYVSTTSVGDSTATERTIDRVMERSGLFTLDE